MVLQSNWNQVVNVSNYNHVEQFISSFAMSKVVAENKLPDKSVNKLPMDCLL